MEVNIDEVSSTIQTVDDDSILTPEVMNQILSAVLQAVENKQNHAGRVRDEQRITGGVSEEQQEGWR